MNIENRITNYGTSASVNNLIIAHETANGNSTIDGEVSYMKNHWNSAFVTHFVGGGGRIIQTAPVGRVSWGAGAKANPYAYAQIELCRAKDKATFKKDYEAYIWLLRDLAGKAGIPKTLDTGSSVSNKGIKTHLWVTQNLGGTNHTDPYGYLSSMGISKAQFKKDIENGISETPKEAVKVESKSSASNPDKEGRSTKFKRGDKVRLSSTAKQWKGSSTFDLGSFKSTYTVDWLNVDGTIYIKPVGADWGGNVYEKDIEFARNNDIQKDDIIKLRDQATHWAGSSKFTSSMKKAEYSVRERIDGHRLYIDNGTFRGEIYDWDAIKVK